MDQNLTIAAEASLVLIDWAKHLPQLVICRLRDADVGLDLSVGAVECLIDHLFAKVSLIKLVHHFQVVSKPH